MPAAYAHYTFGKKVLANIENPDIRRIITEHRALFDIGLHGPDILFFYRPLKSNPVSKAGHLMHAEIAAPFFRNRQDVSSTGVMTERHPLLIFSDLSATTLSTANATDISER